MSRAHLLLCNVTVVTCVVDPWFCNYPPSEMKRPGKPLKATHNLPPPLPPHVSPVAWNPVCVRDGSWRAEDAEVAFYDPKLKTIAILTSFNCQVVTLSFCYVELNVVILKLDETRYSFTKSPGLITSSLTALKVLTLNMNTKTLHSLTSWNS